MVKSEVTTIIASNGTLSANIKDGSTQYWCYYAIDAEGKNRKALDPTDITKAPDGSVQFRLSAPKSTQVMQAVLVVAATSDEDVVASAIPDAGASTAFTKKEMSAVAQYATIDVRANTDVDYELWTKADPSGEFVKKEDQSGRKKAPTDLNLLDDIVIGDPDAYEIKVVVTSPKGDGSTGIIFHEKK
ncbi:MAG: hypothetical protein IPM98_13125 [Lewinellaceae bacterium]|nr:hypothetical protein [Lewinellaceae bacterium]